MKLTSKLFGLVALVLFASVATLAQEPRNYSPVSKESQVSSSIASGQNSREQPIGKDTKDTSLMSSGGIPTPDAERQLFSKAGQMVNAAAPQDAGKCSQLSPANQNWRGNLDWCIGNSDAGGATNCPQDYPYPECIASGGRSCLMKKAIQSAKDNDYNNSYRLALVCQCHNSGAKDGFMYCAGTKAIGDYLRNK